MANQPQQTPDLFMIPVVTDGGLPPKTISRYLKTIYYQEDDTRTRAGDDQHVSCVVCMEDLYVENEATAILACGHEYHIDCIKLWLQRKNLCPLCNAKALPVEDDHHLRLNINHEPVVVVQIHDSVEGQGSGSDDYYYNHSPYSHQIADGWEYKIAQILIVFITAAALSYVITIGAFGV